MTRTDFPAVGDTVRTLALCGMRLHRVGLFVNDEQFTPTENVADPTLN
jgi:hypothetical protein